MVTFGHTMEVSNDIGLDLVNKQCQLVVLHNVLYGVHISRLDPRHRRGHQNHSVYNVYKCKSKLELFPQHSIGA